MENRFRGTGVAMVTPFEGGKIDHQAIRRIVNHLVSGGIEYIVPLGSTGESSLLTNDECRAVLDIVIDQVANRIPVVAGNFGGTNTADLCAKIKSYDFSGIDAILSSSPSYVKPTQEGIYDHYMALEAVSPVPIILYNVPGRTKSNMNWQTTVKLAQASKKFIGIKEASADLIQIAHILKYKPDHFFVTSGDDEHTLPMIAQGCDGVISVISNAFPQQFSSMVRSALAGDFENARMQNNNLLDIHHYLYNEGNPTGIKAAMEVLGLCHREPRLPLKPMTKEGVKGLSAAMDGV